jgi:tryptophan-rich sensory protein
MKIQYLKLVIAVLICLLAGFIGSVFTSRSVSTWYTTLDKPSFNPPDWVFAPVWTLIFILMGISLYLVWYKGIATEGVKVALIPFAAQFFFNILWSLLFFGLQSPFYAFIEIIILWITILLTIIYFYRISKVSSYLLIPYILWVSFAAVLNFMIVMLN